MTDHRRRLSAALALVVGTAALTGSDLKPEAAPGSEAADKAAEDEQKKIDELFNKK